MERRIRGREDKVKEEAISRVGVGVRAGCYEEVPIHDAFGMEAALEVAGYLNSLWLGSDTRGVDSGIERLVHDFKLGLRDLGGKLKEEVAMLIHNQETGDAVVRVIDVKQLIDDFNNEEVCPLEIQTCSVKFG